MRIIRGKYGRRRFDVPTNITARPTTDFARENIFNVIENHLELDGIAALDLFAGTGAVSFELLSRGCAPVTAVEKAQTQYNFIKKTAHALGDDNLRLIKGDVHRFVASAKTPIYDLVFADPPYDLPDFVQVVDSILASPMAKPGALIIIEHSKKHDFGDRPGFAGHRAYGSVNFSIFIKP